VLLWLAYVLVRQLCFIVADEDVRHALIILAESERVGALRAAPKSGRASTAPTVGEIIRAFKSITAIAVNRLLCRSRQPLWQRNYYEHVVRNEQDLNDIRQT
jgi:predicted ATPase